MVPTLDRCTLYRSPSVAQADEPGDLVTTTEASTAHGPHRIRSREQAQELGRKSGEARRVKAAARAALAAEDEQLRQRFLDLQLDNETLGPAALDLVALIIARIAANAIPVRNGAEAAALIDKLHTLARLEAGQSTANRVTVHVDETERRAKIDAARVHVPPEAATAQVSTPAPALELDTPPSAP